MKNTLALPFLFVTALTFGQTTSLEVGQVLIVSYPTISDTAKFQTAVDDANKWLSKRPAKAAYFEADRGKNKGKYLFVCSIKDVAIRRTMPTGSMFPSSVAGSKYTEYQLVGADKFGKMPTAGILGFHYIKVKPERAAEFGKFVVEKLHPAVGHLFPDMQMLYFKAVAGDAVGSYITVWTIESVAARDKYWPAGSPETAALIAGYKPHGELAKTLETFLVPDSYLKPGNGAAAIFESIDWTDYVIK
jgi:hypothetical protein